MSSKFIVSNRVHDPPRDFTSVPACTYINSSGQEFIDMETHQMDIDAIRMRTRPAGTPLR